MNVSRVSTSLERLKSRQHDCREDPSRSLDRKLREAFMQFIDIRNAEHGFFLDPTRYLEWLERCGDQLPEGAAALANDLGHCEFGGRCMKSLVLDSVDLEPCDRGTGARLVFRGGQRRTLVIRYTGITASL